MSDDSDTVRARFIARELAIAIVINCAFSAVFVYVVFGDRAPIELWGVGGLAMDFLPQTFIMTAMTVIATTLVTRQSIRLRKVTRASTVAPLVLPQHPLVRAAVVASVATIVFGGIATVVLASLWPGPYDFSNTVVLKVFYGAIVAAAVALMSLRYALSTQDAVES